MYYNQNERIVLSVDASKYGLGACFMQQGQPVAYGSRSLSKTAQNYCQLEKDMLSIVFRAPSFINICKDRQSWLKLTTYHLKDFFKKTKVREKSRECHNHKPQPIPDTTRKRKPIKPNKHKSNKRRVGYKSQVRSDPPIIFLPIIIFICVIISKL